MSNLNLKNIPKTSGIYQFFDKSGKIIYIGKSVNLFSRVHSYFNGKSKLNFAKQKMVDKIAKVETIIVENETESLILETNLIKENLPKYNILMKDGKNHVYIKITREEFPKIIRTRIKNNHGEYFGPYISSNDVDNILKVSKKIFGYGVGKNNFFKNKTNYNLDEYLFEGNIKNKSDEEIKKLYFKKLESIKSFIKGDYKEIIEKLKDEMFNHAQNHEFERADVIKKQIESIETLNEKQIVRDGIKGDYDIINYLEKFDKVYIGRLEVRDSRIVGFYPTEIENTLDDDISELIGNYVKSIYLESLLINREGKKPVIISSKKIKLSEDIFSSLKFEYPKIGTKHDLLKMCYKNIYDYAYKKYIDSLSTKGFSKTTMINILDLLGYSTINKDIVFECNDISHISGNHTVASRSVIENGKTANSKYKKFNIKDLEEGKINDFGSMEEVMNRRIKEIEKTGYLPDLIVIDGGKGQLGSVLSMIESNISKVPLLKDLQLVSLAKKEEELFLPGETESILLKKDSNELRLIQKIRDEAHRFAITFNRDKRIKSMKKNILESLPGFGTVTRKKLLNKYGSVDELKNVSFDDLKSILNKNQIETLQNHGLID